ncbi:hypothetical protein PFNF135_05614 [Plasmodium falciparum NF135/5.C10]|uniref:Uncharacterized protein n=2 Tax=Plasmodium falciparum TaxID=5833 RepID=A0A024X1E2_PLAFC|nr:hypothetical protein PFNF135_05614 [Plasmodium falciparum NF135/5.C10]ETW58641.1 hypothetical protein PFMC_05738 [Plasmodium falciparum CAMP/Malaysia]
MEVPILIKYMYRRNVIGNRKRIKMNISRKIFTLYEIIIFTIFSPHTKLYLYLKYYYFVFMYT